MRSAVAAFLCVASVAAAQTPQDFRSSAPLTPAAGDPLQRFTLPFEAYRDARSDLADIRVFNGRGEAMPMAYASEPDPTKETRAATPLAMFPLYGPPQSRDISSLDIYVKSNREGAIVSVHSRNRPATSKQEPIAWLLDASSIKTPIRNLVVDWNAGPGLEVARITVEGSDDLKSWTPIASSAPVLTVQQGGQQLQQRKVDLHGTRAKYLRVSGNPAGFVLRSAQVEPDAVSRAASRMTQAVPSRPGAKAGEYVFDLGARLPVEAVRLKLAEANSVAPFTLLARDDPHKEGRHVTNATFYRLVRDGVELEPPPVEVGRVPARHWIARLDPRSPAPGGAPTLEVQWRPAQVVFVARGDGPFALAFGNPDAKPSLLGVSQLIPGYERLAELKLLEAKVGQVQRAEKPFDSLRELLGDVSPRRIALWAILGLAVVALGWMAWRLHRQMGNPAS